MKLYLAWAWTIAMYLAYLIERLEQKFRLSTVFAYLMSIFVLAFFLFFSRCRDDSRHIWELDRLSNQEEVFCLPTTTTPDQSNIAIIGDKIVTEWSHLWWIFSIWPTWNLRNTSMNAIIHNWHCRHNFMYFRLITKFDFGRHSITCDVYSCEFDGRDKDFTHSFICALAGLTSLQRWIKCCVWTRST